MSKNLRKMFVYSGFFAMIFVLIGCPLKNMNLVGSGSVKVDIRENEHVSILHVRIYQDGKELVIIGQVQRRSSGTTVKSITGHVDMEIVDSEGNRLKNLKVPYYPASLPGSSQRPSYFNIRLEMKLPERSFVRLSYHTGKDSNGV